MAHFVRQTGVGSIGDLVNTDTPQIGQPVNIFLASAHTRATIAPTVRQAIRVG